MRKWDKLFEGNMETQNGSRTTETRTTNRLIKPVVFMNPDSHEPVRFYGADGREKPFVIATPDNSIPYTIVKERGNEKITVVLDTNPGMATEKSESDRSTSPMPPEALAKQEETKASTVVESKRMEPQRPVTLETLMAPNITHEAPKQGMNAFIPSNTQTPGLYNFQWQPGIAPYINPVNSVPVVDQQSITTEKPTDIEAQRSVTDGMHYTDQLRRIQQLPQLLAEASGTVTTENTTKGSFANQPKQVPGKQAYRKAEVQFTSNGYLQITVSYSSFQTCAVVKQLYGGYQIFKLEYESDASKDRRFQIVFGSGIIVLGKQKGLTEDALYRYFMGAGVDLKDEKLAELPVNAVKEALYVFFKKQIEGARKIAVDGKAGWLNGTWNWLCTENNLYTDREVVPNLPIMNKKFWTKDFKQIDSNWMKVFDLYKEIPNESYRILFMEILIGGVLSSKFNEAGASMKYFLNLVLMEGMRIEPFCQLFQVFNRDQLECYELSGREKPEKYLMSANDQMMILHSTSDVSDYRLRQGCERLNKIVDAVCYGAGHGSVVVINSERTDREDGINFLVDSSFVTERMSELLKQDVVGDFLQKLISWVSNCGYGQQKVKNILHTVTYESSVLDKVRQILEAFCKSQGLDLYEMLGTSEEAAREINADPLCMENELSVSDIVETIRTEIRVFQMAKRSNGKYADDTCYYDTETIWVPVTIMERIFELGEVHDKVGVLKALKQEKVLLGKNKLTTTITTVDEKKLECYRLKLSALNSRGKVELALLGKETK